VADGDAPVADGDDPVADGDAPVADGDAPVADGDDSQDNPFAVAPDEQSVAPDEMEETEAILPLGTPLSEPVVVQLGGEMEESVQAHPSLGELLG
jgi:hypothetical protein